MKLFKSGPPTLPISYSTVINNWTSKNSKGRWEDTRTAANQSSQPSYCLLWLSFPLLPFLKLFQKKKIDKTNLYQKKSSKTSKEILLVIHTSNIKPNSFTSCFKFHYFLKIETINSQIRVEIILPKCFYQHVVCLRHIYAFECIILLHFNF